MSETHLWDEIARDPEAQGARLYADGHQAFNDEEFAALIKATFLGIVVGDAVDEGEEEVSEAAHNTFNEAFVIFKMYRLHEAILRSVLGGYYIVTGVENGELVLERAEDNEEDE